LRPLKSTTTKVRTSFIVDGIRLLSNAAYSNFNEHIGGVTKYRGGCRIFIIPAGYVGCAFWAGLFVSMSGSRIGGTIVAAGISGALLISLWYVAENILRRISFPYSIAFNTLY
jgi:hypothetical protein